MRRPAAEQNSRSKISVGGVVLRRAEWGNSDLRQIRKAAQRKQLLVISGMRRRDKFPT
jgi:hypothetical protein